MWLGGSASYSPSSISSGGGEFGGRGREALTTTIKRRVQGCVPCLSRPGAASEPSTLRGLVD